LTWRPILRCGGSIWAMGFNCRRAMARESKGLGRGSAQVYDWPETVQEILQSVEDP
jgi:hypothetical protein